MNPRELESAVPAILPEDDRGARAAGAGERQDARVELLEEAAGLPPEASSPRWRATLRLSASRRWPSWIAWTPAFDLLPLHRGAGAQAACCSATAGGS